jgi:hypothetical protein
MGSNVAACSHHYILNYRRYCYELQGLVRIHHVQYLDDIHKRRCHICKILPILTVIDGELIVEYNV